MIMEVKIKRTHPDAVIPSYAKDGDAGLDLTATTISQHSGYTEYGTGICVEIPKGYVGLLFPRSSVTTKGIMLKNSVGVIDSGYRGEIKFRFQTVYDYTNHSDFYTVGERIGQLVILPYPTIEVVEVDELLDSERGTGGYGSSGN